MRNRCRCGRPILNLSRVLVARRRCRLRRRIFLPSAVHLLTEHLALMPDDLKYTPVAESEDRDRQHVMPHEVERCESLPVTIFIYLLLNRTRSTKVIKKNSKKSIVEPHAYIKLPSQQIVNNGIDVVCCKAIWQ